MTAHLRAELRSVCARAEFVQCCYRRVEAAYSRSMIDEEMKK